jgi:hypothetical protein
METSNVGASIGVGIVKLKVKAVVVLVGIILRSMNGVDTK